MTAKTHSNLGCGQCGYAVEGLPELKCPECGADLTVVGIVKPGRRRRIIRFVLVPLLYSAIFFAFALLVSLHADKVLPTYGDYKITLQFNPESNEYQDIIVWADAVAVTPPGQNASNSIGVNTSYAGTTPTTTVTMSYPNSTLSMTKITLAVRPASSSNLPMSRSSLNIDVNTGAAEWFDAKTQAMQVSKTYTEQDVLSLLNGIGADTNNSAVINEAKQLHELITGLINGQQQITLQGMTNQGHGYGGSGTVGPAWVMPTYWIASVVLWLLGLVILVKRARKRAEQIPKQK